MKDATKTTKTSSGVQRLKFHNFFCQDKSQNFNALPAMWDATKNFRNQKTTL